MNYYILPKNNFKISFFLSVNDKNVNPFISFSLIYHLNDIYTNLLKLEDGSGNSNSNSNSSNITIDYINQMVNPFEFIHTTVPGSLLSVSKMKPESNIFFELMEILQICNLTEVLTNKNKLNIGHFTPNNTSTSYLINMFRNNEDDITIKEDFNFDNLIHMFLYNIDSLNKNSTYNLNQTNLNILFFEFKDADYIESKKYINNMILVLFIIINNQANNGTSIIKLDGMFYKIIIDIVFIITSIYDKVFLIKPTISNITKGERYLVCKGYNDSSFVKDQINELLSNYLIKKDQNIHSLINNEIPYYFLNKIEECNSIIGQQQLEAYDQIINILKNKNKEDKIESLKKNHIQKCIQWCEKNQIPHNKFTDKVNIFLVSKKDEL
jgi:hypothetical protein